YAQLREGGESVAAILTALRAVLEHDGVPMALYTDRAHWAVHTPTSGSAPDRQHPTQVGRALARLGIEHILGYSPQARGRSERAGLPALARRHLSGQPSAWYGARCLGRYDPTGQPLRAA